ncbi:MAG: 16S rRNA (cytosine(1402)-N(4))-methyltransferase RsmH, partial [Gemmatimonadota bacterium]
MSNGDALGPHAPVLAAEAVEFLVPEPGERIVVDCTLGAGGHAALALEAMGPAGRLLGIDRDETAIAIARERLADYGDRVRVVKGRFDELEEIVAEHAWDERVGGVLLDLGVSSMHLDNPERGFSFRHDAPLDMRMDPTGDVTAADILNNAPERELTRIIRTYGEERWAARIAHRVVRRREVEPLRCTGELVDLVRAAIPAAARATGGN